MGFITAIRCPESTSDRTIAVATTVLPTSVSVPVTKPIAAGADPTAEGLRNADALALIAAANVPAPYQTVNPYCLKLPASPHIAAANEGITLKLAPIVQAFGQLTRISDLVVVEAAGGWLAPINEMETMADIAAALDLPVLLVVGLRLGCLNHALLTAQAIEARGLTFAGWIANHLQPRFDHAAENIATLEARLAAPLLDVVPFQPAESPAARRLSRIAVARIKEVLRL